MMNDLIARCKERGIDIFVTQGVRTIAEQDAIYAQGRTAPGPIVTQAKGGQSMHNFGVAFDIAFKGGHPYVGPWDRVALIAADIGLEHGDRGYIDIPHFQFRNNHTLQQFQGNKVDWSEFA